MALPSRSLAVAVFRFVLVALIAFVALVGSTILVAALVAWPQDEPWDSSLYLGFVCSMIFWLFVVVFHLRRETQNMAFSQKDQYVAKAKTVLQEMGYYLSSQNADTFTFRPRFQSYLFGGSIQLTLHDQEAKVTGPKVALEIFRRCFRLLNHVQRVQLYLQEHRRFTENVIKRVELQLRIRPEQFEAVRNHIIALLQKDGKVICELSLLVQSEKGIRETTLDFQVREWLEQQGIDFDIHKDIVQFVEVSHPELEPVSQL